MRYIAARTLWVLLFLYAHLAAHARQAPGTDTLLQRYAILPTAKTAKDSSNKSGFYLVKFRVYPGMAALQPHGIIKTINRFYYILQQPVTDTLLLKKVVYAYPANNNWKCTNTLLQKLEKLHGADSLTLQVQLDSSTILPAWCVVQRKPADRLAVVKVKAADWPRFIAQPVIRFADAMRKPKTEIIISSNDMTLNRVSTVQQLYPNLQGQNMTVSIKENLFDTTDTDLTGRYTDGGIAATQVDAHATIMATLIAGAGNTGREGRGAAIGAHLTSSDFNTTLLPDDAPLYGQLGVRVQNHSYGTGIENYYGTEAAAYDAQTVSMDTLLHVFSSGNDGNQAPADGLYSGIAGVANLSGTYKQAKNVLVAGGTDGANNLPALSARGPAYDGRVKPELVAYGLDGTSNAAALTSGIATLVQDAFRRQYGKTPSAALLKTILINSADDIGAPQVDYQTGFGAINALQAVTTVKEQRFLSSTVANGSSQDFTLTIPAGTQQLKVTLGWPDPAAAANATKALVNDLDLWVTDAANTRYDPWVLSIFPAADSLQAPAHRGLDTLNNTEQVTINDPGGVVHIHVNGRAVPKGPQAFYVAYAYIPKQYFRWDNPAPQSNFAARNTVPLRWQTTHTGTGNLSYSRDSVTWQPVAQNLLLANGTYSWELPGIFSKAWLRMQTADTTYTSAAFYISPAPELHVGFNCTDSTLLYWRAIPGANAYDVYALGNQYLETYLRTRDTFILVPKQSVSATWFAVSAIHPDGWSSVKSYGLDYRNQGLSCYVTALLADPLNNTQVRLTLTLGSLYNLKTIWWERLSSNTFVPLQSTAVTTGTNYTVTDASPRAGINYYRVRLETQDGRMLYSDTSSALITGKDNAFLLFPNPATTTLLLISREPQARVCQITDMNGRLVRNFIVASLQESINVSTLAPGGYVLALYEGGKRVFVKQFVKE
ncbi:MAG TPA: S8 family serine peptidase [Chitinophaga sp.]|uniref:S8 family serine peptidase n=1 Tax=Chitinophaga sp. TaxID=1869181 RepID=UPI002DB955AB|nr:S8 family serine peptidase [Chitinophaga sp.]HEU4555377.1 S8 family serine peptidase [Chitinophaga sp.]